MREQGGLFPAKEAFLWKGLCRRSASAGGKRRSKMKITIMKMIRSKSKSKSRNLLPDVVG
jgi:hypothetical protein